MNNKILFPYIYYMRNVFFTLFISFLIFISCDNQNIKDYNFIIIYVDDMGYGDVGSYGCLLYTSDAADES